MFDGRDFLLAFRTTSCFRFWFVLQEVSRWKLQRLRAISEFPKLSVYSGEIQLKLCFRVCVHRSFFFTFLSKA